MTRQKTTNRILAVLLAVLLLVASMPLVSLDLKAGANYTGTVSNEDQWNTAVSSGGTVNITLGTSLSVAHVLKEIPSGTTVNLDLNGYSIYLDGYTEGSKSTDLFSDDKGYSNTDRGADGKNKYFGLISNKGTLNITGSGTIMIKKILVDAAFSGKHKNWVCRLAAIYNEGTLNLGSDVNVEAYAGLADREENDYAYTFSYVFGVYNRGTLTTAADITAGNYVAYYSWGHVGATESPLNYSFAYGIYSYSGSVTTTGGNISVRSNAGGMKAANTTSYESNHMSAIGTGIMANDAVIRGDTSISVDTVTWMSTENIQSWKTNKGNDYGSDLNLSYGIMYTGKNYPVIGPSVDISTTAQLLPDKGTSVMPGGYQGLSGTEKTYTVRLKDTAPGKWSRQCYAVSGFDTFQNMDGTQTSRKTEIDGFLGAWNSSDFNSNFDPDRQLFYPEYVYDNDLMNGQSYYLVDASAYDTAHSVSASALSTEVGSANLKNGYPGTAGSQAVTVYRYFSSNSFSTTALEYVSFGYESFSNYLSGNVSSYVSVNSPARLDPRNGAGENGNTVNYVSGGEISGTVANYFNQTTTYANISLENYTAAANDGTQSQLKNTFRTAGESTSQLNNGQLTDGYVVVVYKNVFLKTSDDVYPFIASPDKTETDSDVKYLNSYLGQQSFDIPYTGSQIVPGEDFNFKVYSSGGTIYSISHSDDTDITSSLSKRSKIHYHWLINGAWTTEAPTDAGTYGFYVNIDSDKDMSSGSLNTNSYSGMSATNYVTIRVVNVEPKITYNGYVFTGEYGQTVAEQTSGTDFASLFTMTDPTSGGSYSLLDSEKDKIYGAGTHTIHIKWTPDKGTPYSPETFAVSLKVTPKNIYVYGSGTVKIGRRNGQNQANPSFSYKADGVAAVDASSSSNWAVTYKIVVNGKQVDYSNDIGVGEYKYVVSAVTDSDGSELSNYNITLNQTSAGVAQFGTLNITEIPVTNVDVKFSVSGGNSSGSTLTASIGDVYIAGSDARLTASQKKALLNDISYQWYRVKDSEIEIIDGSTNSSYTLTDNDEDCYVGCAIYISNFLSDYALHTTEVLNINGTTYDVITYTVSNKVTVEHLSFWEKLLRWIQRLAAAITRVFNKSR